MCGSGKSEVADYMMSKHKYGFLRFGQITLDEVKKTSKKPSEVLEKKIREGFRAKHGMAAFAILNIPKFDQLLTKGDTIGDGMYSWEEYVVLRERYGKNLVVIAVYASPEIRYARLSNRSIKHGEDKNLRFRNFTPMEAAARDKAEIENLHKGGPIAMADYTIVNDGNPDNLYKKVDDLLNKLEN